MAASRKLYRELASAFKVTLETMDEIYEQQAVTQAVREIAGVLKRDNPQFRYDKFYAACGLNEWGQVAS